jgi:hypothetical protein
MNSIPPPAKWTVREPLAAPLAYALCGTSGTDLIIAGGSAGKETGGSFTASPKRGNIFIAWKSRPAQVVLSAGGLIGGEMFLVGGTDDAANLPAMTMKIVSVNGKNWCDHEVSASSGEDRMESRTDKVFPIHITDLESK